MSTRVLFATSEAFPLIKTGGLGDVSHSLPNALATLGMEVVTVLPGYPDVLAAVRDVEIIGDTEVVPGRRATVLQGRHDAFRCPVWFIECPGLYDRDGNPYVDASASDWPDNPERFCTFSRIVAQLAMDTMGIGWRPDIVHCNDWQTGMVPAFLSQHENRPCTVYTIHNVSYDCLFDYPAFERFQLPPAWWSIDGGEFYDRFSMMKAGIVYSDAVTTVSPRYAREICTPEFGYGYAGILQAHSQKLTGIINGVDTEIWHPEIDRHLATNYTAQDNVLKAKSENRAVLLNELAVAPEFRDNSALLAGFIGRLVFQKGIDLLLDAIPRIVSKVSIRFLLIGTGDPLYEARIHQLTLDFPHAVASFIGYSERFAHLLEAGCDLFVMPSRFEPCGLNQMYSMIYGTPPVVRNTGGLSDTVCNVTDETLADRSATGFVFDDSSSEALVDTLERAVRSMTVEDVRDDIIMSGMTQNLSWENSARRYQHLFEQCALARADT